MRKSFVLNMTIVAAVKRVSSRATLIGLLIAIFGSSGESEISFSVIGHKSWRLPPISRSPISVWDKRARKYGVAFLR